MNPVNQPGVSFGQGANLLGAQASNVLGMPHGIMQQSPSSAGFTPGLMPSPPSQAPQAPTMAQAPSMAPVPGAQPVPQMPQQAPQQGVVGMPPGNPEALSIVKALTSRLSSLTKAEEMQKNQTI